MSAMRLQKVPEAVRTVEPMAQIAKEKEMLSSHLADASLLRSERPRQVEGCLVLAKQNAENILKLVNEAVKANNKKIAEIADGQKGGLYAHRAQMERSEMEHRQKENKALAAEKAKAEEQIAEIEKRLAEVRALQ